MNIRFFMNKVTGTWHLHQRLRLLHEFHMRQEEDTTTLAATDRSDKHKSALNILFAKDSHELKRHMVHYSLLYLSTLMLSMHNLERY